MVINASTNTFHVLDQALCHDSDPFRIEVMGHEGFLHFVSALAVNSKSARPPGSRKLFRDFRHADAQIGNVCHRLTQLSQSQRTLPVASEWLLDNRYIVQTVIDEIKHDLPVGYYRELPALQNGHYCGYPRLYQLSVALLAHSDSNLNISELHDVVNAYQEVSTFSIGELWALPTMLRLGLLENLRRLSNRILGQVHDQQAASTAIDTLLSAVMPRLPANPSPTFTLAFWEGLKETDLPMSRLGDRLTQWNEAHFKNISDIQHMAYCQQAADQVTIGNAITSLRLLGVIDWADFVETHSIVEKLLRSDSEYVLQDFVTRDSCRRSVEEMARDCRQSEFNIAQAALAQAQASKHNPLKGHIGYWLLDDGRHELKQQFDVSLTSRNWLRDWMIKHPHSVFFGLMISMILAGAGLLIAFSTMEGWTIDWLLMLIALIPLSEISIGLLNHLISWLLPPRLLPRYEWKTGIPAEHSTLVVIPAIVSKPEAAELLLERLEQHYLSNPDPQLRFALLTDFHDADQQQIPCDQEIVHALLEGVIELNQRHHFHEQPRFFVLHRHRQFNAAENCWMGWERKRGKLQELNQLLRSHTDTSYSIQSAPLSGLPRIKYVLTLDADTVLPSDAARQLISRLAHPLNQSHLSSDGRRVLRGYGILQPRVNFLYDTGLRSRFSRWFSSSSGIDPYSSASSDTYMDLYGSATFTGKGLYEVDAFAALAGRAFPDNHILSHDLIESNFARCALASDVQVFDDFPSKYLTYASREHRWIRGDWQLLPWLQANVPAPEGHASTTFAPMERWKILDNLRRSLVSTASLLLLTLAWFLPHAPGILLTILAVLPFLLPSVIELVSIVFQFTRQRRLGLVFNRIRSEWSHTLAQAGLQLIFLPFHASICLNAIVRTLYRLFKTRKHLLEWESAAIVEQRMSNTPWGVLRTFWQVELFTLSIIVCLVLWTPTMLLWASPFLISWLLSPYVAYLVSLPVTIRPVELNIEERKYLEGIVQKTWMFFEKFVGEEDHWLPPDNYQENPCDSVAHRTSPTNIGAYLLCVLAAHSFKLITSLHVIERLRNAFDTIEQLDSHRGHLLNWYDTRSLHTLHPEYVSTVDSGNLLACLLALKHGLLALAAEPDTTVKLSRQLRELSDRADSLATRMDFRFLYNRDRELFAIGYNADTQRLDSNHYDLLASEACIASFLTIALGQTPRQHWSKLGRLFTLSAGRIGLISWGGTMFEYLMPRLLLPVSKGVMLDQIQHAAVLRQMEYGKELGLPWGISESAYYAFDGSRQYQYQSFGVPGLGLKRGLSRDRVLAPYATLLAVDVQPREAIANLKRLARECGEGKYGFYEAIDYTTGRLPANTKKCVIQTYMAHHQGMGMLALTNCLQEGLIRRWLHAEPAVRSAELLLQERLQTNVPVIKTDLQEIETTFENKEPILSRRRIVTAATPVPRTHLMSNGRYSVMITNAGSGFSRFQDIDVTRWRSDPTTDCFGQFVYVRNRREANLWSLGHQPVCKTADEFEVIFSLDKADFHRVDCEIDSLMEVTVVPDADVEIRRISLTNLGRRSKHLDLTSYAEVVLQSSAADRAHPAFGKLFLETEWLPQHAALICKRRPRSPEQEPLYAIHVLADDGRSGTVSFETDRAQFVGRRHQTGNPVAMDSECRLLSGTVGAVLDPIFSIRRSLKIRSGERAELAFITGIAVTREAAITLADRYHALSAVNRGFEFAYAHTQIEMQHAHLEPDDVHLFQRLAGYLYYPAAGIRAPQEILVANHQGQAGLWSYSLSGDFPICLLRLHSNQGLKQLAQLLKAHRFWSSKSLRVDLVILCENAGGYYDETFTMAINLIRTHGLGDLLDRPAGIKICKGGQIAEADRVLLLTTASIVIDDRAGPLNLQGTQLPNLRTPSHDRKTTLTKPVMRTAPPDCVGLFHNGYGGFSADQLEYVIQPNQDNTIPPLPWSNVIANAQGGFLVTDSGGGFVWAGNSQLNRLTPWSNDPVSDPPGEVIYLQDIDNGQTWCPTPLPLADDAQITVSHGRGYSSFQRLVNNVEHDLTMGVPQHDAVKISLLKLKNHDTSKKRLAVTYYVDLVLGTHREVTAPHLVTWFDSQTSCALLARNAYNPDYPEAVTFAASNMKDISFTGNRMEFIGRNRTLADPLALHAKALSGQVGAGLDPCAALRGIVDLLPGQELTLVFVLGQGKDHNHAKSLIGHYTSLQAAELAMQQMITSWDEMEDRLQVHTPDRAFNLLVNHCLLYQTLSCRYWGRSAFYQSGGAFGFRDQLQDVMALVYCKPELTRAHLLLAASRQFEQGDVQHWWHEPRGFGVRTRFSDDFLWLPFVLCHYIEVTGDHEVLNELVPFLAEEPLAAGVQERYGPAAVTESLASLYDHARRALEHGWRLGVHGLPLIGCGDWNDGMNHVGIEGRGESIWVAWFQINCLRRFGRLARFRHDITFEQTCETRAQQLKDALEKHGYSGAWYLRAYFDDGTTLGSAENEACQIDSIAQSWAVLSGMADADRSHAALDEVMRRLVDTENKLIKLFDPPFNHGTQQPGYIKGYLPGTRENGGQYTHAACWTIQALARLGRTQDAWKLFDLINPVKITQTATSVKKYQGEPYVIAADVYSHPQHPGRAGWTWYTGSSSWLYRVALEDILGFHLQGDRLQIRPAIPGDWKGFSIRFRFGKDSRYNIDVTSTQVGAEIFVDDQLVVEDAIKLVDDGKEHSVLVRCRIEPTVQA